MNTPVRLWDKTAKKMIYPADGGKNGIFLTMDGRPVQHRGGNTLVFLHETEVMQLSTIVSDEKRRLYEQDICDIDIPNEYGSFVKGRGVVCFKQFGWTIALVQPKMGTNAVYDISRVEYRGNVHENPELLKQMP